MKKIKAYKCNKCGHITTFSSFWKWLFTGVVHIDPAGLRWFKCKSCGRYSRHIRVRHITEK